MYISGLFYNEPTHLCGSISLRIQQDICIFQAGDTLLRSYTWENSWLWSHKRVSSKNVPQSL